MLLRRCISLEDKAPLETLPESPSRQRSKLTQDGERVLLAEAFPAHFSEREIF